MFANLKTILFINKIQMYKLSWPGCVFVHAFLSWLSCHGFPFPVSYSVLVIADLPSLSSPGRPVRLTCPDRPVLVFLSRMSCPGWPILTLLSRMSCHGCPTLVMQSQLSCPCFSCSGFLSSLSCPGCPVLIILSPSLLPCASCPDHSSPPFSCHACLVLAVQSRLSFLYIYNY